LEHSRADRDLAHHVDELKAQIASLTRMGGGVNESRAVIPKGSSGDHDTLRLLAMLRNQNEVLNAVAERMGEINRQVDRVHELVGVLMQSESAIGQELAVTRPSQGVRSVIPRMGRLPYSLRFRTERFLELLDELRKKPAIDESDILDLFTRATEQTADHYETLLFMAYILGLLGQYELADQYCQRALQSAERHQQHDTREARFFHVVCTRALAAGPKQYQDAIALLDELTSQSPDPRYLAEHGNIRLIWSERALKSPLWRQSAPSPAAAVEWLERALAQVGDDRRLLASIQNSLSYAWTCIYDQSPSDEARRRSNGLLVDLISTLTSIESNPDNWPLRIKDTIARGILTLNARDYPPEFLRQIIDGLRADLESDTFKGDRSELRSRLADYEAQFRKISQPQKPHRDRVS
jgi:tetratricopeptide (TPR) repeat protein